ncbi:Disease resistance protein (CC-NBS-LRR class) family [Rhynchospora pubera]|uniref:Disease resistance protein (CC-NBS-LRR class) family n=1 Tax=Rhynchospora pubera TaxID=906938 RepID=A0AAV8D1B9_9POAL|nr:Disease resistance protein (CC-NBS-LRR class) family [Rhynchospora pubera]KAJ4813283.1 Disease resistance protein (CC-NBS-LRR class) family [Rhynchospora pubera]
MDMLGCSRAIGSLLPWVASKVSPHVVYPFKVCKNVRVMELATSKLKDLKKDVEIEIADAERVNGTPTNQVQGWLHRVETIENEAADIVQKYQQMCRCIWNISPNLCSNYKISKRAAKKHNEAMDLCEEKATIQVIMMLLPQVQEMPASSSKSSYLESVLHDVIDDVHSIIGIWGMGGIGKTHLLEQINNALSKDLASKVFVVFVTCSKEYYEENVQNTIIEKLRLSKSNNRAVNQLTIYNFLKEKSFVLLLDDLWSSVNLKTIGIPDPMEAGGAYKRKVVLTTRSEKVCRKMGAKKIIKLDVLNWETAWSLFKKNVSEETINSHPLIEKCARDVVKKLGGLPLALIVVGKAMYDKNDPSEWEQAVVQLKQVCNDDVELSDEYQSVFKTLRFSYDSLHNENLKQCFLHWSLWRHIEKNDLVELWMGLGLIDKADIQEAYNVGYNYMRTLQAVSLLEIVEIADDSWQCKMHDVIRDMALWIASNDKVDLNKCIVDNGHRNTKTLQLELFSEITVLNLSWNSLEAFPDEICKLVHLQYLNLSYNFNLRSLLPEELVALSNLKYLLLRKTKCILPKGVLSKLKALRMLDLSNCYDDADGLGYSTSDKYLRYLPEKIFPALEEDLEQLHNFQALGITISEYDFYYELSKNVSVPVRWLDVLGYNGGYMSFSNSFLGNSQLQRNLFSLRIRASGVASWVEFESANEHRSNCCLDRLEHLSFEWMLGMTEVKWKRLNPKDVFPRLRVLTFDNIPYLTSISWVINLPCIRELYVLGCDRWMEQLFRIDELNNGEIIVNQLSFPSLKIIHLSQVKKLVRISDPIITFPVLEILKIHYCDNLKKLPFKTGDPPKSLKYIIGTEEWWDNVEMEDSTHRSSLQLYLKKW